jgi:hypothetical protein
MSRLNLYEQQTSAQGPRADGYTMGTAPAQALEGMGNALQEIGARVQRRDELGVSQHVMENADEMAQTALTDLGKRQDINTPKAMGDFEQAMQQIRKNGMMQFEGTAEGRAALERQLDNQLAQYRKSAVATKIKAGQEQMGRVLDQQFNKSVMQVDAAPDIWSFAKDEILATVERWKPAMSKEQYESAKRLAHAKPLEAAIRSHIAQGNIEAARAIMRDENSSKFLTAQEAIPLRIDIEVEDGRRKKEQREREVNRRAMSNFFGVDVSPEKAEEHPDFMKMPAVQKMSLWRMMNPGQEMPDDVKMKALGIDKQSSESRMDRITEMISNYDSLDEVGRLKLSGLIQSEWKTATTRDSFGNVYRDSTVPDQFRKYAGLPITTNPRTGNPVITGSTSSGGPTSDIAPLTDENGNTYPPGTKLSIGGQPVTVNAEGRAIADDGSPISDLATSDDDADDDVIDLYANYDKMTGVTAWVKRNAANLPLNIGDSLKINPAYGKAAMASEVLTNDITRGFISMGEGKDTVANQYRQELKKIVSIEPKLIGSDREYLFKLQSINKELKQRRNEYQKIAETGATEDMRKSSIAAVATITKILSRIPIPEKVVDSDEEFAKLKPGETFITSSDPRPRRK